MKVADKFLCDICGQQLPAALERTLMFVPQYNGTQAAIIPFSHDYSGRDGVKHFCSTKDNKVCFDKFLPRKERQ